MKLVKNTDSNKDQKKISDKDAEEAFKTILTWMGEDPNREGLLETPKRVVKAFKEYFKGYKEDPNQVLDKTFGDVEGYDDMVLQKKCRGQNREKPRKHKEKLVCLVSLRFFLYFLLFFLCFSFNFCKGHS